jgi:hypothetical protein
MKFISTKAHGVLDYLMGALLLALPFLLDYNISAPESIVLFTCGALMLLMAMITQYEPGIFRVLPMPLHLTADILAGGILALSPVLFDFGQVSHLPHTVVGIFEVVAAFLTTTVAGPSDRRA